MVVDQHRQPQSLAVSRSPWLKSLAHRLSLPKPESQAVVTNSESRNRFRCLIDLHGSAASTRRPHKYVRGERFTPFRSFRFSVVPTRPLVRIPVKRQSTTRPDSPAALCESGIRQVGAFAASRQALYRRPASDGKSQERPSEEHSLPMATTDSNVLKLAPDAGTPAYRSAPHNIEAEQSLARRHPGQQRRLLPGVGFSGAETLLRADPPDHLRDRRQPDPDGQGRNPRHAEDLPSRPRPTSAA